MKLRGINFSPIFDASGVEGFFGEGYWYHKFLHLAGFSLKACTFVSKTTTLNQRAGNMPLNKDGITPKEFFPRCIKVKLFGGFVLNSVGLSGPGAITLFEDGRWQKRQKPFFLSFMSIGKTPEERINELKDYVNLFANYLSKFKTPVGLQINYSCPNVGLKTKELIDEIKDGLQIASMLSIPLMPKLNITVSVEIAK